MGNAKIIVGTDFSEQADVAVHHAMAVARKLGSDLVLVHALSMPDADYRMPYPVAIPEAYQEHIEKIQKDARAELGASRERYDGQGVELSQVFVDDMPDRGVLQTAEDMNAALVVMGSHGRTGLSRFFLGSVAERVLRKADCDVLIAKNTIPKGGYKKILVPTDFSKSGDAALAKAVELIEPGGQIELYHAWQLPGVPMNYWGSVGPGLRDSIQKGAIDFGAKAIEKFSSDKFEIKFVNEEGDARHGIEKRAEEGEFDLVIMGSHHRKGLNRVLLGSVAESTVRHLKSSIYVVRANPEAE